MGLCVRHKRPSLFHYLLSKKPVKNSMSKRAREIKVASKGVLLGDQWVCSIGLGTLPCGVVYPDPFKVPHPAAFEDILTAASQEVAALPLEVDEGKFALFVDTADTYCEDGDSLHSVERQIGAYLRAHPDSRIVVATKGGMKRIGSESSSWRPVTCTVATVRGIVNGMVTESANALLHLPVPVVADAGAGAGAGAGAAGARLFLWQFHHLDDSKQFPITEAGLAAEALAAVDETIVSYIGLCNVSLAAINIMMSVPVHPARIISVQNEYSFWNQEAERDLTSSAAASNKSGLFEYCSDNGIVFIASAPLGGLKARDKAHKQNRNLVRDFPACVTASAMVGARLGVPTSPHKVYLAYLLLRGARKDVKLVLIPGARTAEHAADSVSASQLILEDPEIAVLDAGWLKK